MEELKKKALKLIEEYIWFISDMEMIKVPGLYGANLKRIELHDEICDLLQIDHVKSKDILSYLEDFGYRSGLSDSEIQKVVQRVVDKIFEMKELGEI